MAKARARNCRASGGRREWGISTTRYMHVYDLSNWELASAWESRRQTEVLLHRPRLSLLVLYFIDVKWEKVLDSKLLLRDQLS